MTLQEVFKHKDLTGIVYVKLKNQVIRAEHFRNKSDCKRTVKDFVNEYPQYDVSVIFNE